MKINKLLVPLDGSRLAEQALAKAVDVAHGEPTFLLVRAAEALTWPGVDPTDEQIRVVREAKQPPHPRQRAEAVLRGTTT
jgi:hypothetical protein